MIIIPAIDIIGGKCVRLTQGDYNQKIEYHTDPLEGAKLYEGNGLNYLHMVDLDGAKEGKIINYRILEKITSQTKLKVDFGGGLKSEMDLKIAFECGANQVTGGTIAVKNKPLFLQWLERFGSEKIILGADFKADFIATDGWQESSDYLLLPFLESYFKEGIRYVISTDISKDGLLNGCSLGKYEEIRQALPSLKLIASGGVTTKDELEKLFHLGCYGVIIGKALYEGHLLVKDVGLLQETFFSKHES
ncbi:MAG: 1-(5-phosphoribosyl)-5-[(5-phosphoribosylamino)methylideneamino]imidazole-4-carboxamide isomerase [Bacteroidota bacterium]